ncbi:carboxylate--amine ligase [Oceanobacillus bengalensis]|uniref:Carboxylate--amine ligase n=1 Tax=Oceanobacillus bengalensis TaxID=1435466 RepID=A0A494YXD4_9BACI|nr:carboxylate--amine ligase [Oceanobacillus bengalensis]RKQ14882.1 carboxylate--amine ligase [Oceanobacillus bengalensis]
MNNKAVILGNNYYIGLSTMRCLGIHGIHTVAMDYSDENRYGAKSKYCNEKHIVPHYQMETEKFIDALIDYAKKQELKPVLIPCHDSYLEVIDAHLDKIREYYLIPQTKQGLYTTVMDKGTLHQLAIEKGIKVPETVNVHDENFHDKVENVIKFPCLIKPVDSPTFVKTFRRKLFKVHSMEELEEKMEMIKESGLEVIVQRIIPGFDDHMYTFDAYLNQDAKVTHWTTCNKYRQFPVNFGASVYTVQKHVPELFELGSKFLEEIKFKGFAEIEFKKDAETGEFYLIEINARITNLNSLLYKVGLNFPYITYMELTGKALEPKAITRNTNTAFWYLYEDALAIKDYIKTGQLSLMSIVKTLFRPKAYAIWDWKDPKPGLAFTSTMLDKVFKKVVKR